MPIKITYETVKASFEKEDCVLLSTEYKGNRFKLDYICPKGHTNKTEWFLWKTMKYRCPQCAKNSKPTIEEIRADLESENYILRSDVYINNKTKINYECPKGHQHSVVYSSWKAGYRCPYCNKTAHVNTNKILPNTIIDGIIYKVTNSNNGKVYIGQTTWELNDRKLRHEKMSKSKKVKVWFHKALNKYGFDSFIWEIIEYCNSKEELDEMEFHFIKQYNSFMPNGYNMTCGGEGSVGRVCKQETKDKISINKKGKPLSEEHKQLLSSMRRGVPKSKEHVACVAESKSRHWFVTYPDGANEVIKNLSEFCRQHSLSDRGMWLVANRYRTHHKGFKCRKLTYEEVYNLTNR